MPTLPAQMQQSAQKAADEGSQFSALPPGVYTGRLAKLTAAQAKSTNNPMWSLEFDEIHDLEGHKKPGRQFTNLVLIDAVEWKVGQFFGAFGVPTSTNTDNLIGQRCRLQIGTRVITQGARTGQEGNEITGFVALAEADPGFQQLQQLRAKLGITQTQKPPAATAAPAAVPPPSAAPAAATETPAAAPAGNDQWSAPPPASDGVEF